jgi:hypothetical protein
MRSAAPAVSPIIEIQCSRRESRSSPPSSAAAASVDAAPARPPEVARDVPLPRCGLEYRQVVVRFADGLRGRAREVDLGRHWPGSVRCVDHERRTFATLIGERLIEVAAILRAGRFDHRLRSITSDPAASASSPSAPAAAASQDRPTPWVGTVGAGGRL